MSGGCCFEQRGERWYAQSMPRVSIRVDVPDLKSATTFYRDALGCSIDKEQATHDSLIVNRMGRDTVRALRYARRNLSRICSDVKSLVWRRLVRLAAPGTVSRFE